VIYMASQQGYSRIFMAMRSPSGVVGLPLSLPRFDKDVSSSCSVTVNGESPPETVGEDCEKAIVKVAWAVPWKQIAQVLQSIVAGGVAAPSLTPHDGS
jgi:hypothetical protein